MSYTLIYYGGFIKSRRTTITGLKIVPTPKKIKKEKEYLPKSKVDRYVLSTSA